MALVDYTLDTEVDPNGDIARSTNTIDVTTMRRDVSAYEYRNRGAGHFVDVDHLIDAQVNSASDASAYNAIHMLANTIGDSTSLETADDHHVKIWVLNLGGTNTGVILREWHNGSSYQDTNFTLNLDTPYYYTFKYVSATRVLTCKIYSDSGRTTLVDTLTLTLQAAVTWKYRYSTASRDGGGAPEWSGWVKNTDLQEAAIFQAAWARNSNQIIGAAQ